jgi:uncharacterized protein (DUF1800 family)
MSDLELQAKEPSAADMETSPALAAGLGVLAVATLAGCGGGGGGGADGGNSPPVTVPDNTITKLTIKEASGAAITVNGVAGSATGVTFLLNGGNTPTNKAADPGKGGAVRSFDFATVGVGGTAALTLAINPEPTAVAAANYSTLASTRSTVSALAFAPSWDELMGYSGLTHAQIVDRMIARMSVDPAEPYPSWIDERVLSSAQYNALSQADKDAYNAAKYPRRQALKAWWFRQMVTSPDSLTERLLLFWHNVFTTSATDIDQPTLMARQHRLFRQHVGGNLRTFLKAMARDPAMVLYLDSALNKKGKPNENFARELLELFSLGEISQYPGGYAESDVPTVARCFTGYGVNANKEFLFNPSDHDYAGKTLWGVTVDPGTANDGDWAIDRILAKDDGTGHSACAKYIVTRMWREFIGDVSTTDGATILALADQFSGAFNWDLKSLYRALFTTPEASSTARRGTRIRSPVELHVTYFRATGARLTKWEDQLYQIYSLDQDLFDPPNVFGWQGGTTWITVKTLVDRRTFMDWTGWGNRNSVPASLLNVLDLLLMARDPLTAPSESTNAGLRAREYMTDPSYNLR